MKNISTRFRVSLAPLLLALAFAPLAYGQQNLFWTVDQNGITDGSGMWNQGYPSITAASGAWYDNISMFALTMNSGDNVTIGGGTAGAAGIITVGVGGVSPASLTINQAFDNNAYYFTNTGNADGITIINGGSINNFTNTQFYCPVNGSFTVNNPGAANTYLVLDANGNQTSADTVYVNGRLSLATGGGLGAASIVNNHVLNYNTVGSISISNPVSGGGNVQYYITGGAIDTMVAPQTYTGLLQLYPNYTNTAPATLAMGGENVAPDTDFVFANVSSNNTGCIFDLAGYDQTLNSISGYLNTTNPAGGPTVLSPGNCFITNSGPLVNLTIGTSANSATKSYYAGIYGPLNLVLNGSSVMNLYGLIDITGNTTVSGAYSANFCSLSVQSNGLVELPSGTLNLANGTVSVGRSGTLSVQTLLATNNTATSTNSIVNWGSGGTIMTSNLNGIAANIAVPVSTPYGYNDFWIMNGGTNYLTYPYVSGTFRFTIGSYGSYTAATNASVVVNANAVLDLTNSVGTNVNISLFMGGNCNNNQLIVNGGTLKNYVGDMLIGYSISTNNFCMITNGGQVYGGVSVGQSTSNNFVLVGSSSRLFGNVQGFYVGAGAGSYNTAIINGGIATNVGLVGIGSGTGGLNNSLFVTNGGQIYGAGNCYIGNHPQANNDEVLISGNGSVWGGTGGAAWGLFVADSAGVSGESLTVDGGVITNLSNLSIGSVLSNTNNSLLIANGGRVYSGLSSGVLSVGVDSATNTVTVVGSGSLLSQANNIYIGYSTGGVGTNSTANSLVISNGATVTSGTLCVGRLSGAGGIVTNNYVIVGGGGATAQLLGNVTIGFSSGVTNNYLVLNNAGVISNSVITIGAAGSVGSKLYFNGGTVVAKTAGTLITTAADGQTLVQAGGAVIDDNGLTITSSLPLNEDPNSTGGSLAKQGAGTLTLSTTNAYTGGTTVRQGTLLVNNTTGTGTGSGTVTVNGGAILGGSGKIGGGVTFAAGAFATNVQGSPLTIGGTLTLNNNVMLVRTASLLPLGDYLLMTNTTGSITGSFNNIPIITGSGVTGTGTIVTTANAVTLHVANTVTLPSTGTNITFSVTGGNTLNLSWPTNYVGWQLMSNSVSLLITNDWFLVPGSTTTNSVSINIDPTKNNVYYRMHHP